MYILDLHPRLCLSKKLQKLQELQKKVAESETVVEIDKIATENDNFVGEIAVEVENIAQNVEFVVKIVVKMKKVDENVNHVAITKALGVETSITVEKKFVLPKFEVEGEFTKVHSKKKLSHLAATTYGTKRIIPTSVTIDSRLKLGKHRKNAKGQGRAQNKPNDKLNGTALHLLQRR